MALGAKKSEEKNIENPTKKDTKNQICLRRLKIWQKWNFGLQKNQKFAQRNFEKYSGKFLFPEEKTNFLQLSRPAALQNIYSFGVTSF